MPHFFSGWCVHECRVSAFLLLTRAGRSSCDISIFFLTIGRCSPSATKTYPLPFFPGKGFFRISFCFSSAAHVSLLLKQRRRGSSRLSKVDVVAVELGMLWITSFCAANKGNLRVEAHVDEDARCPQKRRFFHFALR